MDEDYIEDVAQHLAAVSTLKRLKTYLYLVQGVAPKQFLEEDNDLDVTRATIQDYINDFKHLELIEKQGKQYRVTEKGERFKKHLELLESELKDQDKEQLERFEDRVHNLREKLDEQENEKS